jgi:hypothetical protein
MGKPRREWQDTDCVLRLFGSRLRTARGAYERFVVEGVGQGRRPELVGGGLIRSAGGWSAMRAQRASGIRIMGDERILGNGGFVQAVLDHAREQYEKRTLARAKGLTLETLLAQVAQQMGLVPGDLSNTGRNRTVARARAVVCALAVEYSGFSGRELSRQLNLSPSAVSKLVLRGRKEILTADLAKALLRVEV